MSLNRFRPGSYQLPVLRHSLFSNILSLTNIFHHSFLNNHASQPLQTWYGAFARGPTYRIPNSDPPVICFLVYNVVYFPIFRPQPIFSVKLFSATMHHSHFKLGMVLWLGILHIAYRISFDQLSTSCFRT